ncbi:MAG: hypothetical protein ACXWBY_04645 [Kaistella sp.]
MRSPLQISAAKNYFFGFATSGAILLAGLFYFNAKSEESDLQHAPTNVEYITADKTALQEFDPNLLSGEEWKNLGFSERQVATILKYKNVVGGEFSSKEQLKKCYAISEEKFSELEPYILLPEKPVSSTYRRFSNYSTNNSGNTYRSFSKKELKISGKFNPDHFTATDFVKMGFTENQANSILKYKNYLGGSFISKEKFKDCFIISDENYRKMEPYLLLPEKTPENFPARNNFTQLKTEKAKIAYQPFDPNLIDLEGWRKLGFSEKQAQVIINYRDRNLKGSFKSLDDIERCFVISEEKFAEIKPYIVLNPENFKTSAPQKNYASNATASKNTVTEEVKTDFSKIDLNQITYKQLLEFGFDEKSAAMMLGFRKKLGGFVNRQQIIDTYDIDKNLAQKLVSVAILDDSRITKYTLVDAPEEWLKSHPYFKYSADKIIYYRITDPNEKKIWKFIKVKPEHEARMKLYLK